jgi:hypothetical protein
MIRRILLRGVSVLAAATLTGAAVVPVPASAAVRRLPFSADSGDQCPMGSASGTIGWHEENPTIVDFEAVVVDHPLPDEQDPRCAADGRHTKVTFTALSGSTADSATHIRMVDDGQQYDPFDLKTTLAISVVVVKVCRISAVPGQSYCGQPRYYVRPG